MSIKDKLDRIDSKLAERRVEYEQMQREAKALRTLLQQKERACAELKTQVDNAKVTLLTEELVGASRKLMEKEGLYRKAMESRIITEEEAQKDHRLMEVYEEQPELKESLKRPYQKAQEREAQRKQLKEKLPLEVIIAREKIEEQFNTIIIAPIGVKEYEKDPGNPETPNNFMELLLEWLNVNLINSKVGPQSGEYHGFFKATIPGTPKLKFDLELPDEFKVANVSVETVVLDEKEFVLGEALPLTDVPQPAGEYTLSTGKKVDSKEYYSLEQTAKLLGYKRRNSIMVVLQRDTKRREKGIAPKLPAEECIPDGWSRNKWRILGQSIIDYDERRSGKGKPKATVTPALPESVDEVVQPAKPEAGEARATVVPEQDTFTVGELSTVLGISYGGAGNLIQKDPRSGEWKVKGQSKTGYKFNIPRAVVVEFAEKHTSRPTKRAPSVTTNPNLMGVVEASRYIADKLKECGVEYAVSTIGVGLPARRYADRYFNHQPGLKLPAERDDKKRILVHRDGLEAFVDKYVKEEIIKPQVKAGKSYEEIIAQLPEKYHASVNAFIAHRSQGDYEKSRKKTKEPVTPPLEWAAGQEPVGREAKAEDKDYFSTTEAAELIGVSSRAVQMYIAQGKIAAELKYPHNTSAWKISRASLDAYLVKIGKKAVPAEPVPPTAPQSLAPSPVSPKPALPEGELERRHNIIESTLGKAYASRIKANKDIVDIKPEVFDNTYLPLLMRVWSKIRTIYPTGIIPDDLSPICRPSIFGDPERLAKLEEKVNQDYLKLAPKPADKPDEEKGVRDKVDLIMMYTKLDETLAKELLPNLEQDGGTNRIDALEKVLAGAVEKDKVTDAATQILQANVGILITSFDFEAYRTRLASTLEKISGEYIGEVPDFYNPLKTPQNFTNIEALENVDRVLKKAILKKGRGAGSVSPDRDYYARYASEIATAVEDDGFNLGMICAIVDHGINVRGRKGFAGKTMSAEVLKKKVSGFYNGKFDGRVYENNLRSMVSCGAMLEQDKFGKSVYSLAIKLPESVPASLRAVLQPFYVVATTL